MTPGAVRIIGLDPGLRRTGWGIIETSGSHLAHIANGVLTSDASDSLAARLVCLSTGIADILETFQPGEAAVEETFVSKDARATLKLGHARAVALLMPARRGLPVSEYAPNLVKKTVVGVGHAGKAQVLAMINVLLPTAAPANSDAADALAVAICHAQHRHARAKTTCS